MDPSDENYSERGCPHGDKCAKGMHGPQGFIAFECRNGVECDDENCEFRHSDEPEEIERSAMRKWELFLENIGGKESVEYTRLCTHHCTRGCKFPNTCRFAHGLTKTRQFASVKTIAEAREAYESIVQNFVDDCNVANLSDITISSAVNKLKKELDLFIKKLSAPRLHLLGKPKVLWGNQGTGSGYTQGAAQANHPPTTLPSRPRWGNGVGSSTSYTQGVDPQVNHHLAPVPPPARAVNTNNFVITHETPMFIIPDFDRGSFKVYLTKDYELPPAFAAVLNFTDIKDKPFKVAEIEILGASSDLLLAVSQYIKEPANGVPEWWVNLHSNTQE